VITHPKFTHEQGARPEGKRGLKKKTKQEGKVEGTCDTPKKVTATRNALPVRPGSRKRIDNERIRNLGKKRQRGKPENAGKSKPRRPVLDALRVNQGEQQTETPDSLSKGEGGGKVEVASLEKSGPRQRVR